MAWYDDVDTTKKWRLGTRKRDVAGNEYVYAAGATSTVAGSWAAFSNSFGTTLMNEGVSGPVGVAMAAISASTSYGWYQIYGTNSIAIASSNGTIASAGGQLQSSSDSAAATLGTVGATRDAITGAKIFGAFAYSAQPDSDSAATGTPGTDLFTVFLNYPHAGIDLT